MDPIRRKLSPSTTIAINIAGLVSFFLAWQIASQHVDPHLLNSPMQVAVRLFTMMKEPFAGSTIWGHVITSLGRFGAGFGLAALIGIPLGLTMGWSPILNGLMMPLFSILRYVAPIAWVPFAVLWFGTGIGGPILIIFSGAFSACVVGAFGGAKLTPPHLIEAARTLGVGNVRMIAEVLLPSALPSIVAALRVAAGNAWQSMVGAELIVASSGLAYIMVRGQMNRDVTTVTTGMLVIGLIGLAIEWVLRRVEARIDKRFSR
ncbi:ABC-type nitrate/sulfonate/bicarbonate transport system permease component [Nitrobacteraceae bacterium AZCC 1564]